MEIAAASLTLTYGAVFLSASILLYTRSPRQFVRSLALVQCVRNSSIILAALFLFFNLAYLCICLLVFANLLAFFVVYSVALQTNITAQEYLGLVKGEICNRAVG